MVFTRRKYFWSVVGLIVIVAFAAPTLAGPPGANPPQRAQVGRYALASGDGIVYLLDSGTGQIWYVNTAEGGPPVWKHFPSPVHPQKP